MSVRDQIGQAKTAFVLAGGGSFGAIQVGMLHSLAAHGIEADMVVGSSVGALNGAFYAGDPTLRGVEKLGDIWRELTRQDVFPMNWRTVLGFLWRRDFLISHDGIRKLIDDHIPYRNLQDARLVAELERLDPAIEYFVVPPLCPLVGSPYEFSRTADHIARAIETTDAWLAQHGLQQGQIPGEMRPHSH